MTCEDIVCKNGHVAFNSFITGEHCVDPKYSVIFEITDLVENEMFENFVRVKPGQSISTFQQVEVEVVYTQMEGNRFKFNFDDGFSEQFNQPTSRHYYTKPGDYVISIDVESMDFPSFKVEVAVAVNFNVISATLKNCSASYYIISDEDSFWCNGYVVGGGSADGPLQISWDFGEGDLVNTTVLGMYLSIHPCVIISLADEFLVHISNIEAKSIR